MVINNILIGRDKECRLIDHLMDKNKNIIIFGKEGVGKSTIINEVLNKKKTKRIFYSQNSQTLKESLINFISSAYGENKNIREEDTLTLRKMFYKFLKDIKPEYLIFDHIKALGPRFHSFTEYLIEKEVSLIILSEGLDNKHIGHLWESLFYFVKIEIANFDKAGAHHLISHYIEKYGINIACKENFQKEIFHFSQGHPGIIKELCLLSCNSKYYLNGFLDTKLMDLDRRINDLFVSKNKI